MRYLLTLLLLCLSLAFVGCDCSEGDTGGAFGPDCHGVDEGTTGGDGSGGSGVLVFSDQAANSIRRFEGISSLDTAVATDLPLAGGTTRFTRPGYLAIHPTSNELITCDVGSQAVIFHTDPLSVEGDVPPSRILVGPATELVAPEQAFIDTETDELYVLDRGASAILVYASASSLDGEVAPTRRIAGPASGIDNPTCFIVNSSTARMTVITPSEILTFEDFRSINGDSAPAGRVSGAATTFQNLTYGLFDSANGLVLVDQGTNSILYFQDFAFDQNNQAPTRTVSGGNTGITSPAQFVLTSGDNMYLANGANVLYFENVRELEGNPFPDRRFSATNPASQGIRGLVQP